MTIHREGYPTLLLVGGIALGLNGLVALVASGGLWVTVPLSLLILGFFTQFFRNPIRNIPNVKNTLVSPADGTVVAIETVQEGEYFKEERLKVSIYMSALNVHLNRVPLDAEVVYTKYHDGQYLVAFHPKASELNERNTVVFKESYGQEILVRQIAGLLARRIVPYMQVGQKVKMGDELGFIKFGSRCDIFMPRNAKVLVQLQQRVKGGETLLAELRIE
jgi:phosphatidylserine decarboxylase